MEREVDDAIRAVLAGDRLDRAGLVEVALFDREAVADVRFEEGRHAGALVRGGDDLLAGLSERPHGVRADEAESAGDDGGHEWLLSARATPTVSVAPSISCSSA